MNYFGASINQSPVIAERAGAEIAEGALKAVKYDANGDVVLCSVEGENAIGILLPETTNVIAKGGDVTVQIKDIGLGIAGAVIAKGAELMVNHEGKLIPATTGKFIIGYALENVTTTDSFFKLEVRKSGYMA